MAQSNRCAGPSLLPCGRSFVSVLTRNKTMVLFRLAGANSFPLLSATNIAAAAGFVNSFFVAAALLGAGYRPSHKAASRSRRRGSMPGAPGRYPRISASAPPHRTSWRCAYRHSRAAGMPLLHASYLSKQLAVCGVSPGLVREIPSIPLPFPECQIGAVALENSRFAATGT